MLSKRADEFLVKKDLSEEEKIECRKLVYDIEDILDDIDPAHLLRKKYEDLIFLI